MSHGEVRIENRARCHPSTLTTSRASAWLIGITLAAFQLTGCAKKSPPPPPKPPEVVVAPVRQQDVPVFGEWVAQLNGPINAAIMPKVQGYVLSQDYVNGSLVRKGQLLFQIDSRPFEAALDEAKADAEKAVS